MANAIIVDDILNTRSILKSILIDMGLNVTGDFEDGLEAFEFCKTNDVDLILLDYDLQCFIEGRCYTGLNFLESIMKQNKNIKVIFVSANGYPNIILNAIKNGASDFIAKPFQISNVIERINKVLER